MSRKHYKHPQYGMVFCNEEINTPVGRGAWFSLVSPKDPPPPKPGDAPGKPRFEATLLLDKSNPKTDPFLEEVAQLAGEMLDIFNDGRNAKLTIDAVVKDGDSFDMEKYPYYKNCWVLVARNASQPETYDVNAENIAPSAFIGGQKIRMRIQPLITANGLSFKLKVIQLLADDGVRFAGGTRDYKSLMAVCGDEESCEASAPEVEVEQEEAPAPVTAPKRGRPPTVKPIVQQVAPPVQATPVAKKVDPAQLRAQAAARMATQQKAVAAPAAKKGIGLALDKI